MNYQNEKVALCIANTYEKVERIVHKMLEKLDRGSTAVCPWPDWQILLQMYQLESGLLSIFLQWLLVKFQTVYLIYMCIQPHMYERGLT